jgi:chaperone modulatory protein CbpM
MITLDDLLGRHGELTSVHIERWVARGLLRPSQGGSFEAVDVARVSLLAELVDDIGLDEDAAETVVTLLDQLHASRRQLKLLGDAIAKQPPATRQAIAETLSALAAADILKKG